MHGAGVRPGWGSVGVNWSIIGASRHLWASVSYCDLTSGEDRGRKILLMNGRLPLAGMVSVAFHLYAGIGRICSGSFHCSALIGWDHRQEQHKMTKWSK